MRCLTAILGLDENDITKNSIKRVSNFSTLKFAYDISVAKELLRKYTFEIVIIDTTTKDSSEIDLLRWIRLENMNTDIIFITTNSNVSSIQKAFRCGVCDYIIKPFSIDRIELALIRTIDKNIYLNQLKFMKQSEVDKYISLNAEVHFINEVREKGLSEQTLIKIRKSVDAYDSDFTAIDIADKTGLSRITVRRYLESMIEEGTLKADFKYGKVGRPKKIYVKIKE